MTRGLPLPWRASLNATLLLGLELGFGNVMSSDAGIIVALLLFPPSFSGTLATTWLVREVEPSLPGEGPLTIVLGLLGTWLGAIGGTLALSSVAHLQPSPAVTIFACASGATFLAALSMRRLTGRWEEDALVTMLVACVAVTVIAGVMPSPATKDETLVYVIVGALAHQAIAGYAVGLWLERATAWRTSGRP
jgi:hypothetical protein